MQLTREPGTIALICDRCSLAEPAHVKIEGSRLLAGLVKYCQSDGLLCNLVSITSAIYEFHGCVVCLTVCKLLRGDEGDNQ